MTPEHCRERMNALNCCILIPTYNNAQTLEQVIKDVGEYAANIIVVNDGSTDSTNHILAKFDGIHVVSYLNNRGKGFALRTGFEAARKKGYDYVITIDSDGQHFADDIPVFVEKLETEKSSIIIGARNMNQDSVPGKSNFGNKFSNFWFQFNTGISVPDTQSGYRLYPVKLLDCINFITPKYEFEVEVIVRAAWRGIGVIAVPVKVYYPPAEERISHFRPVPDFSRVSVLNTFLVLIAVFYIKPRNFFRGLGKKNFRTFFREHFLNTTEPDSVKIFSVMLGFFMGIAPFWGYQMLLCLAIAHILKLNKAISILTANISLPPVIPFILYGSFMFGGMFMDEPGTIDFSKEITLETVKMHGYQYLVGSFALAFAAAGFSGIATFLLLKLFAKK